jgi:Ca-activated chloride channel family protein
MSNIEFANPEFFWLLLTLAPIIAFYILRFNSKHAQVRLSSLSGLQSHSKGLKYWLKHGFFFLKLLALGLIVTALARPQSSSSWQDVTTEGIDIVIALDISTSMLAEDFSPNRLQAAKNVAMEFIEGRPNDRIGLVVYSGESFTQCPLTTDHDVLKNLFLEIKNGMIEDGTAIGLGLANSVNRLKDSEAKSKVVILLTDGINNSGSIPPLTAAEIAKAFDVRVYTIGMGTYGQAPMPFRSPFGGITYQNVDVQIDEESLQEIASITEGQYFRATDNKKLEEIYAEIDQMEKSKIEVTEYKKKKEEYYPWLLSGILLLVIDFGVQKTYLRSVVS